MYRYTELKPVFKIQLEGIESIYTYLDADIRDFEFSEAFWTFGRAWSTSMFGNAWSSPQLDTIGNVHDKHGPFEA